MLASETSDSGVFGRRGLWIQGDDLVSLLVEMPKLKVDPPGGYPGPTTAAVQDKYGMGKSASRPSPSEHEPLKSFGRQPG